MRVRVTSKRQVTFPREVLDSLGVKAGDSLEVEQCPEGFLIRPYRIREEYLAPLKDKIDRSKGPFDLEAFRNARKDPTLRD